MYAAMGKSSVNDTPQMIPSSPSNIGEWSNIMGRKNESGMRVQCQHCGYSWYTQSQEDVTSCPKCGWRVRIRPSTRKNIPTSRALLTERPREPLI